MTFTEQLQLTYAIEGGELTPHLEGLTAGQAIARRCLACGWKSFPPDRSCRCGSRRHEWVTLSGRCSLQAVTRAEGRNMALVAFEGADNSAIARLVGTGRFEIGQQLQLLAFPESPGWPALCIALPGSRLA
jgi:uncharacterized OB-fold protein